MKSIKQGSWSIACVCMVLGFMLAIQFRTTEDMKTTLPYQRVEELTERLLLAEKEKDILREELKLLRLNPAKADLSHEVKLLAGFTALRGPGVIIKMDDSQKKSKAGENPNLYIIHDDDLLRVINELRAAGAEALSVNGQRLIGTSEIRCAGPTLSVNNIRSASPFEVRAIGDKATLENALKMRGGVQETLGVWGIQMDISATDDVYIPAYKGTRKYEYAKETVEEAS